MLAAVTEVARAERRGTSPAAFPDGPLSARLLDWYGRVRRPWPWRSQRDPYRIWVAEVILQQTRVDQAAPYFTRFVSRFPSVRALAAADEADVLKVWEGAGYYARARHLHAAARALVAQGDGRLPDTVDALERLPGVGPYIARAVASIAFHAPVLALEANGLRVATRLLADGTDPRTAAGRRRLSGFLDAQRPPARSGEFNEGLMELGETVCRPRHPLCTVCPLADLCGARQRLRDPGSIPAPRPRPRRPHVVAAVVAVQRNLRWLVQRRPSKGLLGGLWELPGGKVRCGESPADAARRECREELGWAPETLRPLGSLRHAYSHFTVELHLFAAAPRRNVSAGRWGGEPRRWVTLAQLSQLPLPRATAKMIPMLAGVTGRASRGSGSRPGRRRPSPPASTRARRAGARSRPPRASAAPRRARR